VKIDVCTSCFFLCFVQFAHVKYCAGHMFCPTVPKSKLIPCLFSKFLTACVTHVMVKATHSLFVKNDSKLSAIAVLMYQQNFKSMIAFECVFKTLFRV
jgi:hypothetical protein